MAFPARIFGKLGGLAVAAALAGGGVAWWQYKAGAQQRLIEQQAREIEYLENVANRLTMERRIATVVVAGQERNDDGELVTDLLFFNQDADGNPLPAKEFTVVGERVHIDALVIRFDSDFVKEGDPLRGRSIYLWDRIYGSATAPEQGQEIDPRGEVPATYAGDPSAAGLDAERREYERALWDRFWKLAQDNEYAREQGVAVAEGDGTYSIFSPENLYELTIQNNGGISLVPRRMDPITREFYRRGGRDSEGG